jgi:sugar phosphate isomerase/epimerase
MLSYLSYTNLTIYLPNKEVGFRGIEMIHAKLYRYLMSGFTTENLITHLDGLPIVGLGFVADIERQEKAQYEALIEECERMCTIAESIGCRSGLNITSWIRGKRLEI